MVFRVFEAPGEGEAADSVKMLNPYYKPSGVEGQSTKKLSLARAGEEISTPSQRLRHPEDLPYFSGQLNISFRINRFFFCFFYPPPLPCLAFFSIVARPLSLPVCQISQSSHYDFPTQCRSAFLPDPASERNPRGSHESHIFSRPPGRLSRRENACRIGKRPRLRHGRRSPFTSPGRVPTHAFLSIVTGASDGVFWLLNYVGTSFWFVPRLEPRKCLRQINCNQFFLY